MFLWPVVGSMDDVWAIVTDSLSWDEWWLLGIPRLEGGAWEPDARLVWDRDGSRESATARLVRVEPLTILEFEFVEGGDGLPQKRGSSVAWGISVDLEDRGTTFEIRRLNRPRRMGKIHSSEHDMMKRFEAAVERRVRARCEIPDFVALREAGDTEGLFDALAHPESWVRARALTTLGTLDLSHRNRMVDDRVFQALLAASGDPDGLVRHSSIAGLLRHGHERAQEALMRLLGDPDPRVRERVSKDPRMMELRMVSTRPYDADERERLRAAPGPKFSGAPTEPFLAPRFTVYMRATSVYDNFFEIMHTPSEDRFGGVKTFRVASKLVFPQLCSGCLEPTDRILDRTFTLSWERSDEVGPSTIEHRTITIDAAFPLPMCEHCLGYGLDELLQVTARDTDNLFAAFTARDTDELSFRFPNLAFYEPFCEVNGGTEVRPARRYRLDRDHVLRIWALCSESFGFHRYARLQHELLEIGADVDRDRLVDLATEASITPDQLLEIEAIAGTNIPALRAIDS